MSHDIGQMFYYGEEPWHGLGRKLDQPADLEEALKHGGLDWEVDMVPIVPAGEPDSTITHRMAVVRKDRQPGDAERVVGVVHPGFRPLQNREGAELFDALLGQGGRHYHTGGYLRHGEVVWLLAKLRRDIKVRPNDKLETYLLFSNSHDGSQAIDIRLTTIRVVCQNTLSMALHRGTAGKFFRRGHDGRHAKLKDEVQAFFAFTMRQADDTESRLTQLAGKACEDAAFEAFLAKLLPEPTRPVSAGENPQVRRAYETRLGTVMESRDEIRRVHLHGIAGRQPGADKTWWGTLNTVTGWVDHVQATRSDRYAHILFGAGDRIKTSALNLVQAMTL
jgi:phage/plasmid-like protein (TIGR03299 family)